MPSFKAPRGSLPAYISTSSLEGQLGLWAELHPLISEFGRVDVHEAAAKRLGLKSVSGMAHCLPIQYVFDGAVSHYLPDLGARWIDGSPVLAEAGVLEKKSNEETRTAFAAARDYLATYDGHFVVLLGGDLPRRWFERALWLHMWRFAYFGPEELLADIRAAWLRPRTPASLAQEFADRAKLQTVRHAVMKTAGDALAAGRLGHDLIRADFTIDTLTRIRGDGEALLLPPSLRTDAPADAAYDEVETGDETPIPTVINETLLSPDVAEELRRKRAVMEKIASGAPASAFAGELGCTPRWAQMLYRSWQADGDRALIPYASADHHGSFLPAQLRSFVRARVRENPKVAAQTVRDDPRFRRKVDTLKLAKVPSTAQIGHFIEMALGKVPGPSDLLVDRRDPPPARGFADGYGLRPGFVAEGDEETSNLTAQLVEGHPATDREHKGVFRCRPTRALLSLVASSKALDQFDNARLVLRMVQPKDDLVAAAGCENPWPIACLVMVLILDNALINTSYLVVDRLVRLGMCIVFAPAGRPQSRGVVEAGFGRDQKTHEDHAPNSTKRSPKVRGSADPSAYAAQHGISPEDIELDFIRIGVDADLHGWYEHDGFRPIRRWETGAARYWYRTYEGPIGTLIRDLKRKVGERTVSGGVISVNKRDYVQTWTGDRDDDPRARLPYRGRWSGFLRNTAKVICWIDDDDVRTMDVYDPDSGELLGIVVANQVSKEYGRPVSQFELDRVREIQAEDRAAGRGSAEQARTQIQDKNLARPAKRVARAASSKRHIEARQREKFGPATARRRAGRPRPASQRIKAPVLRMTQRRFALPEIRHLGSSPSRKDVQ